MLVVERFHALWESAQALNQLSEKARQKFLSYLLVLAPEVAINICNPDIPVIPKQCFQIVNYNRGKNRLAGAWNTWTEQSLAAGVTPCVELYCVKEPLTGSRLSLPDIVTLLRTVVD